ncbi:MAG: response regulator [Granulosicoccus sp.]|nr:response regulator [Granulosicoccus sp.]
MRILVVDDSAAMRMMIVKTLRMAGFDGSETIQAEDGVDALAKIEDEMPHLVLADWNMPNMNGIELLQKLREMGNEVTFGFITTEATTKMRDLARESGAKFLISKPFTVEMFEEVLGAIIKK